MAFCDLVQNVLSSDCSQTTNSWFCYADVLWIVCNAITLDYIVYFTNAQAYCFMNSMLRHLHNVAFDSISAALTSSLH